MGRSSVGIHIQEHTTPPPSIGVAAPTPVCIPATTKTSPPMCTPIVPATPSTPVVPATPAVPATPVVPATPATLVHTSTPIAPAHGSMAHASASATSDPISSFVGEIPAKEQENDVLSLCSRRSD
ncbi:hypothetical protein Dimus_030103 [Dionaea muscipula]